MNLQKKLIQLSEYRCSFKYVESQFIVSMEYPSEWTVIPSEDRSIELGQENGVTYYLATADTDIDSVFNLIDVTIKYNLDVEKKMSLLEYNIKKLQELFISETIEDLERLKFIIEKPICTTRDNKQVKTKKQSTTKQKKVKDVVKEEVEVVSDDITSNEDDVIRYEPIHEESEHKLTGYLEEVER